MARATWNNSAPTPYNGNWLRFLSMKLNGDSRSIAHNATLEARHSRAARPGDRRLPNNEPKRRIGFSFLANKSSPRAHQGGRVFARNALMSATNAFHAASLAP